MVGAALSRIAPPARDVRSRCGWETDLESGRLPPAGSDECDYVATRGAAAQKLSPLREFLSGMDAILP